MLKPLTERPALAVSELGILLLGLVLVLLGFANLAGAFKAGGLGLLGVIIFLFSGVGCLTVSLCALFGHPRSAFARPIFMAAGWLVAAYPLSLVITHFGGTYIWALPIAAAGMALALFPMRRPVRLPANR